MPTQERLRELFTYKKIAGRLLNRKHRRTCPVGWPVGFLNNGYYRVWISGSRRAPEYLHRLVWIYHNGAIPPDKVIDHIDQNPLNNRIENLRLATASENQRNRRVYPRYRSGVVGVSWNTQSQAWRALITVDGRRIYLGQYKSKDRAIERRFEAEKQFGRMIQLEAA